MMRQCILALGWLVASLAIGADVLMVILIGVQAFK